MQEHVLPVSTQVQQAQQLLDTQLFGDTFQVLKYRYFIQWVQSKHVEEREELHGKVLGLLDAQAEFETLANQASIDQSGD